MGHAISVATVVTLFIAILYTVVMVAFDVVDAGHLVAQVDAHLSERLSNVDHEGTLLIQANRQDTGRDLDAAPIVLWSVDQAGHVTPLTQGAPQLPAESWSPAGRTATVGLGATSFRLDAQRVDGGWLVAGQSLADTTHVGRVLLAAEVVAGPLILGAVFLGTLVIGLKASAPVEQARRRQLEFTADASHELRTPLSVIDAEVSLALSADRSARRYREALDRVRGESARLRRIVEDLLWLARFDSEPTPPVNEPVDLIKLAEGCAERFESVATARDVHLSVHADGTTRAWISAPAEWVDRLLGVLVDNACRYAGAGGTVAILVAADGPQVTLAVDDSGPGIPAEERPRLFDRFFRTTDDGAGSGLGLAIADSVVRSTGGRWLVADAPLGGAHMEVCWRRSGPPDHGPRPTTSSNTSDEGLAHGDDPNSGRRLASA